MSAPSNTPSTPAKKAAARATAQDATEAARETAHEVVEDTKNFFERLGENAAYVAVRTVQEVNALRQKAKPFVKPVVYTAVTVTDPILGIGIIAAAEGAGVVRRRARELAVEDTNRDK